jgi:hypothetical protein
VLRRIKKNINRGEFGYNTLIIGGNQQAIAIYKDINDNEVKLGYTFKGFVYADNSGSNGMSAFLPKLGSINELEKIIDEHSIEEVIIAIDTSDAALEMAKSFGATHTVNPMKEDVLEATRKICPDGLQYTVAAVGSTKAMLNALNILGSNGAMIIVGAPPSGAVLEIDPRFILAGEKMMKGSVYGSSNPHVEFPRLIELYLAGKLDLDSLLTGHYGLDEADKAFEVLAKGAPGRGLITFDK